MPEQLFTTEQIARVCHEANRAVQHATGEAISPSWDDAPDWQRESAIDGVQGALEGRTPDQSHEGWLAHKQATGWTHGLIKDEATKQHPCMVPYAELPPEQKVKDHVFTSIVNAMTPAQLRA